MCIRDSSLYPVRNLYFGDVARFKYFNEHYAGTFEHVVDFPRLMAGELDRVKRLRLPPWEYAEMRWDRTVPEVDVYKRQPPLSCVNVMGKMVVYLFGNQ